MNIPRNRQEIGALISRRRFQGLMMAGVLSAGLGVAATSGAFAAPTAPATFAELAAATPVATPSAGSGTPGPHRGAGAEGFFSGGPGHRGGAGANGGIFGSVATFLGIQASDVQTAVSGGQTLAQVAVAHGKTAADLKTYLLSQESTRIDQLLNANLQNMAKGPGGRGSAGGFFGADVATFLGISQTDLQTALKGGQTLAQVAQAHGKSAADLKTFYTNSLKTKLDAAVAAGKMTAQQETDKLNQFGTMIDKMINSTGPQHRGAAPKATPTTG